ncbi:MAG: Gfo/Idh/MocA family protein [Planctomycetota bacterium]|jgi:predicted dehydrogenase
MNTGKNRFSRRTFIEKTGQAVIAGSLVGTAPAKPLASDRKIRMGIVGGGFGATFQWHEDPNCIVHAVSDLRNDRRNKLMKTYKCERWYESLEKLILDKEIEAVAIYTGAPDHAKHCIKAMNAGKHVLCAVPAAMSLAECEQLREAKEGNDRKYMMAETSYYRAYCMAARELFQQGKFGELFYSEVEYYHPRTEKSMKSFWYYKGKRTWRYGFPPMHYPTHSTGYLVGVTKERITEVSCLGWSSPKLGIYTKRDNVYDNPFSHESALCKTERGHICRCNVFFSDGQAHGERAQWFGTRLAFYMPGSGGQPFRIQGEDAPKWKQVPNYQERLPEAMRHKSGHGGSHTFLTHEFVSALVEGREPAIDVYESLAMTVPGIVAHQSALKGGQQMKVPSFDRKK